MKQGASSWIACGCYLFVAFAVGVSLVLGDDVPLSMGWLLRFLDKITETLWREQPMVSAIGLIALGVVIGLKLEKGGTRR